MIEPKGEASETYTFVGLTVNGATRFMDIAVLCEADVEAHARELLRQHDSSAQVEIWRSAELVAVKKRPG